MAGISLINCQKGSIIIVLYFTRFLLSDNIFDRENRLGRQRAYIYITMYVSNLNNDRPPHEFNNLFEKNYEKIKKLRELSGTYLMSMKELSFLIIHLCENYTRVCERKNKSPPDAL